MSALQSLKAASSLSDVARLLRFRPAGLSYLLYHKQDKYTQFTIPKRNGDTRTISAPIPSLKLLQKRLAELLQDCVMETNILYQRNDNIAHGFKRNHSIITNATAHRKRRYVFNVDLQNFFGAINFGRVRGYFMTDRNFALKESVATVLAQIICHDNALPQGSPCSPVRTASTKLRIATTKMYQP
jgi:hypothetical protein